MATGYRRGGPNQTEFSPSAPAQFKSDRIVNYEFGWKGVVPGYGFDFAASAFRINWKDVQVLATDPTSHLAFYTNGGKAHTQGLELEENWRPFAGLRTFGTLTLMQAQLDQDFNTPGVQGKKGDRIPYSARASLAVGADYSLPAFAGWQATFGGSERYVGRRESYYPSQTVGTLIQVKPAPLPSYSIMDLHAELSNDPWTVSLYMKNVFDKRGALSLDGGPVGANPATDSPTPAALVITRPRTIGVSLRADF